MIFSLEPIIENSKLNLTPLLLLVKSFNLKLVDKFTYQF